MKFSPLLSGGLLRPNESETKDQVAVWSSSTLGCFTFRTYHPGATAPDTTAPSVPTDLTVTAASFSQINLTWTPSTDNTGVAGYRIYRNTQQVASTVSTSYLDGGLTTATEYSYAVTAYDAAGNVSAQSSTASTATQSPTVSPAYPLKMSPNRRYFVE